MDKLTLRIKRQLAFLMVSVLFFTSVPMRNLFVYAQEGGGSSETSASASGGDASNEGTSDGEASGGDVSEENVSGGNVSGGDVSGNDVSGGDVSDGDLKFIRVEYEGVTWVEGGEPDANELPLADIESDKRVYGNSTVTLKYYFETKDSEKPQDVKVYDNSAGKRKKKDFNWESMGTAEGKIWYTSVPVSAEGEHVLELEYPIGDTTEKHTIISPTICIDKTKTKLLSINYSVSSGDSVKVSPAEAPKTHYYNENVDVTFELDEKYFNELQLTVSDSKSESAAYTTRFENGKNYITCSIAGCDEGEHKLSFEYQSLITKKTVSYETTIVIDTTPAQIGAVRYSTWQKAEDLEGYILNDETVEEQEVIADRSDAILYYSQNSEPHKDKVDVTFNILEVNISREDVSIWDNENQQEQWELKKKDSDTYSVTYSIPKEQVGDHKVKLKFQDTLKNGEPTIITTNTIRIDNQAATLIPSYTDCESEWKEDAVDGDKEILQESDGESNVLYYKNQMAIDFVIKEENFRPDDVKFSDVSTGDAIELEWKPYLEKQDEWSATYPISGEGEYRVHLSYQDRAGNKPPIDFDSKRIVLDATAPELISIEIDQWDQAADSHTLEILADYVVGQRQDVNLYYGQKNDLAHDVEMTFVIKEKNFHGADVVVQDEYKDVKSKKVLTWIPVDEQDNPEHDLWTATYTISNEETGKHIVTLKYQDRSANAMLDYTSETIILDFEKPEIVIPDRGAVPDDSAEKRVLYYKPGEEIPLFVREENFRALDISITYTGGDKNATEEVNADLMRLQDPSAWKPVSEGYVSYLQLNSDGKYDITVNYTDLAKNVAKEETVSIKIDGVDPVVSGFSYDDVSCKRMVDSNNATVTTVADDTRYIYQGEMTFQLTITEENFDPNDANVQVCRDGNQLNNQDGYQYNGADNWVLVDDEAHNYTLSLKLGKKDGIVVDGDYQVKVDCRDLAGNKMKTYNSNIITIDTTKPDIAVAYDNNNVKSGRYFDKERVATITVADRNVNPDEIEVHVTAKDVTGDLLNYDMDAKQSSWRRGEEKDTWVSTIAYDMDANYEFAIECTDMATNKKQDSHSFTVDKSAPDKGSFSIEYSTPILAVTEGDSQNLFYKDSVTIKAIVKDRISPIKSLECVYKRQLGASSVNRESEPLVINNQDEGFTYDATSGIATATYTLTADQVKQYRGNLYFKATDMAGNTSEEVKDNNRIVIVDNISPTRTVAYSPADQVVNKDTLDTLTGFDYLEENVGAVLFYNEPMTITFQVTEANFYSNDIDVKVNGVSKSITNWSKAGDVWSGSLEIAENGEHVVELQYTDRSTNKMVNYVSHTIIIDTIRPQIQVSYDPNDAKRVIDGTRYYDRQQTATITIKERNFRAEDVEVVVKATDINGNGIDVMDFAGYLKRRSSWVTRGDEHTAQITFEKDANYEFDIDYKDLALLSAEDYSKDVFTVDQTAPVNVSVSYSTPVSEKTISGTEYEFYKEPVVVTITAEDDVSGVYGFEYSYIRAEGVSSVNAESITHRIEAGDISYSDGKKAATATFIIPASELRAGNQVNGSIRYVADNRSDLTTEYKDSRRYVVDNIKPDVKIAFNGSEHQTDGILYYPQNLEVTINVDEANFYAEDVKVTISKDGGEPYSVGNVSWRTLSVDRHVGNLTLAEEGRYKIYVSYQDPSTNAMENYESEVLIIDKTSPSIIVSGIKNHSANKQEQIGFVVTVEDANLNTSSFRPMLLAEIKDENGNIRQVDCTEWGTVETITVGRRSTYTIANIEQDGIYQLTCRVVDMAGNITEEMIIENSNKQIATQLNYSVNRNGSTYSLSESTKKLVNQFVKKAANVVVYETNPDEISNIKITLFKNDETFILEENKDFIVTRVSDDGDWYRYEYTIYEKNFVDDGTYRISIYSEDRAGNIAENNLDVKNVEIRFGVDKTLPNLIVTNLESKTTYPVDRLSVLMRATDNMKLQNITVELDGKVIAEWAEDHIQQMSDSFQDFVFEIPGDKTTAHTVTISLIDIAGNQRVETITDFYVTTNLWVRFVNNKALLYGSIAGCLLVGLMTGLFVWMKRKKRFGRGVIGE
ncbi:MAG: hypothetical protein IJ147_01640 [Lachnospiraceae bacterium]|nr:hypothetical protein [Lachnospiraceae bacterium]